MLQSAAPGVETAEAPRPIVYVVDDDQSMRTALSSLIRSHGLKVETFESAEEFVRYDRSDAPSCLVADIFLPGLNGLELAAELARLDAPLPAIFISAHGTIPMSVRAMKEGAIEFLTKPFQEGELMAAIQQGLETHQRMRAEAVRILAMRERWERLTGREREVLAMVARGRTNKEIAKDLGIALQTVKMHRGRVMKKIEARSLSDLVTYVAQIALQPWFEPRSAPGDGVSHRASLLNLPGPPADTLERQL